MTSTSFPFTVRALAADPVTSGLLYAGTQGDGVFRSEDGGTAWAPISNGLGSTEVLALAVDPLSPTVVYCGTVGGMYRSNDRGESWISASAGMDPAASVQQIVIDPLVHLTLYAGTSMRVYRSDNGGNEWTPFGTGLTSDYISSLAIDPLDPTILYAGTAGGVWTTQPSHTLATPTSPPEAGSVIRSPDQASFLGGAVVQLTAQPGFGYKFVGWSGDATGGQNPLAVTMDADKTVTANFALSMCAVVLTAPNGSEQWAPDTVRPITWTVTGDTSAIDHFDLYLAVDGSDPWRQIAWYVGSSERSFSWTVPEVLTSRARIVVCAAPYDSYTYNVKTLAWDASDSFFSITSVTKKKLPLVTITTSSAKPWQAGTSQTIRWHVDGALPKSFHHYSIFASLVDGISWNWVHLGDSSTTSFSWYIPVDVGSARVKVIVYATDVSSLVVADAQSELFSITPASGAYGVKMTAPVGGQVLHVGDTFEVTWTTTGTVPPVLGCYLLFFSWNGGLSWQDAGQVWASLSCIWAVPRCLSSDCRIMVVAESWNGTVLGVAVSAVPFSIAP
jgi:uncharacterized repeat protein (TIGR02543 family)